VRDLSDPSDIGHVLSGELLGDEAPSEAEEQDMNKLTNTFSRSMLPRWTDIPFATPDHLRKCPYLPNLRL
jgi:hypothetical protein